jgi:hypothetical protein
MYSRLLPNQSSHRLFVLL